MELEKHPETELEYWVAIESIGGLVWRINHDLADGRFEISPGTERELKEARDILERLSSELSRFGVISHKECPTVELGREKPIAPEGKMWYWDWYHKMKKEFYVAEYEKLICSACLLSDGADEFVSTNIIPCSVFNGMLYSLCYPYLCRMIEEGEGKWDRKKLIEEIWIRGGDEAVAKFETKEAELKLLENQA